MAFRILKRISAIFIICLLTLSSCASAESKTVEPAFKTEGADTVCDITGYTDFSNTYPDYFLEEGDKVAVISPSSLPSREQTDAVLKGLEENGYVPVEGKYVCDVERTLEDCKSDLEWALNDPEIKAVFCVRGGYAATEVMDAMQISEIGSSGKMIVGYSDITAYHSAWTVAGVPSIHASMSAAFMGLPTSCFDAEMHMLKGQIPAYRCEGNEMDIQGTASGTLIGGNLATFTAVLNTEYDCTSINEPYILFLEEVDEDMQHIHRFLTILDHMGILKKASGIIFGEWADYPADCESYDGKSRGGEFASVNEMIHRQFLNDFNIPVAFGFPAGHADSNYPLLMGAKVQLNVTDKDFTIEWTQP